MSPDDAVGGSASGTLRTLGSLWIVYGIIRLIMAVCLFIFSGTATLMFGALLNRVPDPQSLMNMFHTVYIVMIVLSVVCGILGLMAGIALRAGQRSGRGLGLAAGFLSLPNFPLGIALGVYTLVVLLPVRNN